MSEPANKSPESLTREQLLSALDSEIADRENQAARLGYSDWALKGALVTILWTAVNEVVNNTHTFRGTFLVFFVGWNILMACTFFLGDWDGQHVSSSGELVGNRGKTPRQALVLKSVHPENLGYFILECTGLLAIAVFLGLHGFPLLGFVAGLMIASALVTLLLVLIFIHIQLPLGYESSPKRKHCFLPRLTMLVLLGCSATICTVGIDAVVREWANLAKGDLRLGLLLTGLLTAFGIQVRLARPAPDLKPLKSLRASLAFGRIAFEEARAQADDILLGLPKEHYLSSKAMELDEVLSRITQLEVEALAEIMESVRLAAEFKESHVNHDKIIRSQRIVYNNLNAVLVLFQNATRLRKQFELRMKVAQHLLLVTEADKKLLIEKVAKAEEMVKLVHEKVQKQIEPFTKSLEEVQAIAKRDKYSARATLGYRELFDALFTK